MTPIVLDIKTVLRAARDAFDAGTLQGQRMPGGCDYTGPCAIGVALDPAERERLDGLVTSSASDLLRKGVFVCEHGDDLITLQVAHDHWVSATAFDTRLRALEAKHGLTPEGAGQ